MCSSRAILTTFEIHRESSISEEKIEVPERNVLRVGFWSIIIDRYVPDIYHDIFLQHSLLYKLCQESKRFLMTIMAPPHTHLYSSILYQYMSSIYMI